MTRFQAGEAGRAFKVVAIRPGDVQTAMGDAGADQSPREAAESILSLVRGVSSGKLRSGLFYRDGLVIPW